MELSIIIVNYNVEYFLEQCLLSVEKAIEGLDAEVFVVDNNSTDGSIEMIINKFDWVKLIENKENCGFSKANNQAILQAQGKYILLLNPDTLVENDTFSKTIDFMNSTPDAGGLGVKMIDGKGNFLPESKRGLPTPTVAFYKIFGLSKIFKNSKKFGKYHLTYLDNNKIHQVDVLSGAFMLLRLDVLKKIGLLDEDFFMYGEDIDLSYRITKSGYKNYYFPETRIIHYKGESTKKSSVNYVFVFYRAMIIFANKHFSGKNAKLFSYIINLAIYIRATLSIIKRFFLKIYLPAIDFILIYLSLYLLKLYWEDTVLSLKGSHFPSLFTYFAIPSYILIWLISILLSDGYSRNSTPYKIIKGIIWGTIFILIVYAMLPESYRFSRAMILLGTTSAITIAILLRILLNLLKIRKFNLTNSLSNRFIVVGELDECKRVADLLRKTTLNPEYIGLLTIKKVDDNEVIGNIAQIAEIATIYKINEIVFCAKDIESQHIIALMSKLNNQQIEFKIAPPDTKTIIGSNSINTPTDIFAIQINAINSIKNKRNKRLLDILLSLFCLIFFPILLIINKFRFKLIKNIFAVIVGYKSWVGVKPLNDKTYNFKPSILFSTNSLKINNLNNELIEKINNIYCSDYKIVNDIKIFFYSLNKLTK